MLHRLNIYVIFTLILAFPIFCYSENNKKPNEIDWSSTIAHAELGNTNYMDKVIKTLEDVLGPDDPYVYYWTAKMCGTGNYKLNDPQKFMSYLENNFNNPLLKTAYGICKLYNVECLDESNYQKELKAFIIGEITAAQFRNNVSTSPIHNNIQQGIEILRECDTSQAAQALAGHYSGYVDKDWDKAITFYSLTLERDPANAQALSTLSHCYYHGYGVMQDLKKAVEYWEKLYKRGVNWAEWEACDIRYMLGEAYYKGIGVDNNEKTALNYYEVGANDNDPACLFALGNIAYSKKQYKNAYDLYIRSKDVPRISDIPMCFIYENLSRAHRFGRGVTQNLDSASFYWEKAKEYSTYKTTQETLLNSDNNYRAKKIRPQMVFVKGGKFSMGATAEQRPYAYKEEYPVRDINIEDFYIGKYEVTQYEFETIMGYNPSFNKGSNNPVENVSWIEAQEFISKLNELTSEDYYLPSEAEWEYAARGGINSDCYLYIGSDSIDEVAWCSDNSKSSHSVGLKRPNSIGIYDMAGNVGEWCEDWFIGYGVDQHNVIEDADTPKVIRGGGFGYFKDGCRTTRRFRRGRGSKDGSIGFRLCKRVSNKQI